MIREDADPHQCWMATPAFNALYREIAVAADVAATLRSQEREELPMENWDGTPVGVLLWGVMIAFGPLAVLLLVVLLALRRRRSKSGGPT